MTIEGEEVEDRADRADDEHEIADELHVPVARADQVLLVHPVQRDRDLGDVVEEVVEQDLHRQHRQERQEERRPRPC